VNRSLVLGAFSIGAMLLAGCSGASQTSAVPQTSTPLASSARSLQNVDFRTGLATGLFVRSCDLPVPGEAGCHAVVRSDSGIGRSPQGRPGSTATSVSGYGPTQLQGAYALSGGTSGLTVAIVDAYDDPNLESDLGVYRSYFGLPPCTTANGCFRKVNQNGVQGSYPKSNGGWAQEESLDVDMVSANCPACKILVVEANSTSFANLGAAVNEAANLGASAISNSYGGSESSGEASTMTSYYTHPGILITASSGDSGYGVEQPAAFNTVAATGGTSLTLSGTARVSETVWSGAGSGCSQYIGPQPWQTNLGLPGCSNRIVADVSYDADPNTGVAVYDSFTYRGASGWLVFGGTSVASPAIAAIYTRAGGSQLTSSYPVSYTYAKKAYGTNLFDVTSGTNTSAGCSPTYLCTGSPGYDGPTGLGTPIGLGAF
jgi:subtilase family serine protease